MYKDVIARFLKVVLNKKRPKRERQLYTHYLASFISRANYVDAKTICETLNALLKWVLNVYKYDATTNTAGQEREESHPIRLHALFYTVCQCTLYILCSRWEKCYIILMQLFCSITKKENLIQMKCIAIHQWPTLIYNPKCGKIYAIILYTR